MNAHGQDRVTCDLLCDTLVFRCKRLATKDRFPLHPPTPVLPPPPRSHIAVPVVHLKPSPPAGTKNLPPDLALVMTVAVKSTQA